MAVTWFNDNQKDLIATIQDNNITLNKTCKNLIEYAYNVMLGLDIDEKIVHIKPLTKEDVLRGDISENEQYKITIRSSYARVSNKSFINEIKKSINLDDLTNPKKYVVTYDEISKTVLINLNKEVLK